MIRFVNAPVPRFLPVVCSLFLGLTASLGVCGTAQAEEPVKIAYVDMQRALLEVEDGRRAREELKKTLEKKQKELDERQQELMKAGDDLKKKRTLLPEDKRLEKEAELQDGLAKLQQALMRNQQELNQREQEVLAPIVERMQRIVGQIAQSEEISLVLDRNQAGIIFAKTHLDLTNEVIRRYNKDGGGAPAAAAAPAKKKGK
ncbi:MAG: OmpH family outer membrane protein [Myxococcales bacterium]|nr:OmpH family outer membrane protein [Myxococcales bacterium]